MPKLLTADEVAARLNVRKGRVYELGRTGILPRVLVGRQVRFDEQQLNDWIASGGKASTEFDRFDRPPDLPFRR